MNSGIDTRMGGNVGGAVRGGVDLTWRQWECLF
jgi:hypothetical protein